MKIDHSSMEGSGGAIRAEGGDFSRRVQQLSAQLEALIPHFGNPGSDEAARVFRRGADSHPGFDSAHEDLSTALGNLGRAYEGIGDAVVAMSRNVRAADWAGMVDKNEFVKELVELARREDDEISVPTTPVRD
ncbi:hypothetical protein ABGB18_43315 [Nonomuraea sp. B12E4]|uniref:hypothetical protein n=1 Tax=Nonomuraea sp. B12E4 TaxID=3153564 RepID=UPI00325D562F